MAKPEGEYAKVHRGAEDAELRLGIQKERTVPLTSPLVSAPGTPTLRGGPPASAPAGVKTLASDGWHAHAVLGAGMGGGIGAADANAETRRERGVAEFGLDVKK